jgi:hypothetical protein
VAREGRKRFVVRRRWTAQGSFSINATITATVGSPLADLAAESLLPRLSLHRRSRHIFVSGIFRRTEDNKNIPNRHQYPRSVWSPCRPGSVRLHRNVVGEFS